MPTEENGCQETTLGGVAMVAMTKSSSYMSSASSSSYSTTNTGECEVLSAMTPGSSCLARSAGGGASTSGNGDGRPAAREVHRVKFADDLNEYLASSRDHLDFDELDRPTGDEYDDEAEAEGVEAFQRQTRAPGQRGGSCGVQRPSIIKQPRPRSPENHDNPFTADGELCRKADYILRFSTISRRRIRIADPDCIPESEPCPPDPAPVDTVDCCLQGCEAPAPADRSCSPPPSAHGLNGNCLQGNGSPPTRTSPNELPNGSPDSSVGRQNGTSSPTGKLDIGDVELMVDGGRSEASTLTAQLDRPTVGLLDDEGRQAAGGSRHNSPTRPRYNCCAVQ